MAPPCARASNLSLPLTGPRHAPTAAERAEWVEAAWQIFEAIETHCRRAVGYTSLKDVRPRCSAHAAAAGPAHHKHQCFDSDGERGDPRVGQPSYFLAETLKYLLLTFEPELHGMEKLQLDDVVFTTEAHPLSIQPLMCGPPDRRHPW